MRHRVAPSGSLCSGLLAFAALTSVAYAAETRRSTTPPRRKARWSGTRRLIVNQAVRPLIEAFNKKYPGIEVKYARADSGPTAIKIMNEARAGKAAGRRVRRHRTTPPLLKAGLVGQIRAVGGGQISDGAQGPRGPLERAAGLISSRPRSTPSWCRRDEIRRPRRTCSIRNGRARSPGARCRPRAPASMSARCCRPWARKRAWNSCARSPSRTSSMSTPPTARSSIR